MQLTWHDRMDSFLAETLVYLERDEVVNNLMLGLALRLQSDPSIYPSVELVTVNDEQGLILAGLMTVPEKLILYGVEGWENEALEYLIEGLLARKVNVPGVVGPKELAEKFANLWVARTGATLELDMHMRVYELREVNVNVIGEGQLRAAEQRDLDFLVEAIAEFQRDAGIATTPDWELCTRLAKRRIQEQSAFLWEHQGKVVSVAAKSRPTRHGITINMVYTPKDLRGRGYATSCVATLSQQLLDEGYKFCSLFTDLANPTSNSIYQKIGYKPLGDFDGYYFN